MNRKLVITSSWKSIFYLILEDNIPVELKVEDKELSKQTGNIYKGKVKKVVPAMNAYFVDIGEDKEAFLPVKDLCKEDKECKNLKVGDTVIAQVRRSPVSTKGAKLSCKIAIPGKYLVLLPRLKNQISISSKFEDQEFRENLKEHISNLIKPYNEEKYGFIIRTSSEKATDQQIIEDFLHLKQEWIEILKSAEKQKAPSLIYEESFKAYSILRDYAGEFEEIISDDINILKEIKKYITKNFPNVNIKLTPYRKRKQSLYYQYQIDKVINKILSPYVWLKSGAYLIIEETEALTVIDVNSGSYCKQKNLEDLAYSINLEAAKEIAYQIRLRDLAGIIIIDFIDMQQKEHKEALINFIKEEFKKDKRPIKVKGITELGLLEMTRKKIDESLIKQLSESCPVCNGKGFIKSEDIVLFEIEKATNQLKPFVKLIIKINPKIAKSVSELIKNLNLEDIVSIEYNNKLMVDKFELEKIL